MLTGWLQDLLGSRARGIEAKDRAAGRRMDAHSTGISLGTISLGLTAFAKNLEYGK